MVNILNNKDKTRYRMKRMKLLNSHGDICPYTPWTVALLDNLFRRLIQNPKNLVGNYVRPGMTVLDIGCGTGYFTLAMAGMVGPGGNVIAVDVQKEMLDEIQKKSKQHDLSHRIRLHISKPDAIGIQDKADFILSFYMVHEVPERYAFFSEVAGLLAPGGTYLVVEPKFHVSKTAFDETLYYATQAGFSIQSRPKILFSRAALLVKESKPPVSMQI